MTEPCSTGRWPTCAEKAKREHCGGKQNSAYLGKSLGWQFSVLEKTRGGIDMRCLWLFPCLQRRVKGESFICRCCAHGCLNFVEAVCMALLLCLEMRHSHSATVRVKVGSACWTAKGKSSRLDLSLLEYLWNAHKWVLLACRNQDLFFNAKSEIAEWDFKWVVAQGLDFPNHHYRHLWEALPHTGFIWQITTA